jgi:hypothetical protein
MLNRQADRANTSCVLCLTCFICIFFENKELNYVLAWARDCSGKPPSVALRVNSTSWQTEGACNGKPGALRLAGMPPKLKVVERASSMGELQVAAHCHGGTEKMQFTNSSLNYFCSRNGYFSQSTEKNLPCFRGKFL